LLEALLQVTITVPYFDIQNTTVAVSYSADKARGVKVVDLWTTWWERFGIETAKDHFCGGRDRLLMSGIGTLCCVMLQKIVSTCSELIRADVVVSAVSYCAIARLD